MTALTEAYGRIKVLVIEDEAVVRRTLRRMLEQIGIAHVAEAADGSTGFDATLAEQPDIVLCDIHMTPVDGNVFLDRVRAADDERLRTLPILFLTGDNLLDSVRVATQHHVDGYIVKPVSLDVLKQHIDIVIARLMARRSAAGSG